ncbi:hypothetical protein Tsubulata_041805, partial [Turnera subulata]
MDSQSESLEKQSTDSIPSFRGKSDPAWEHFSVSIGPDKKLVYKCLICEKQYKGGGIFRMKQHLAGIRGSIGPCRKVSHEIREQMLKVLKELADQKMQSKQAKKVIEIDNSMEDDEDSVQEEITQQSSSKDVAAQADNKGKRKKIEGVKRDFAARTTPGAQPSIKSLLVGKDVVHKADMAVARFFFGSCIPFNAIQAGFFQPFNDPL